MLVHKRLKCFPKQWILMKNLKSQIDNTVTFIMSCIQQKIPTNVKMQKTMIQEKISFNKNCQKSQRQKRTLFLWYQEFNSGRCTCQTGITYASELSLQPQKRAFKYYFKYNNNLEYISIFQLLKRLKQKEASLGAIL